MSISSNIGILEWENEAAASGYPLKTYNNNMLGLIIDAYWFQLDGFVPTLQSVSVDSTGVYFNVLTYSGKLTGLSVSGENVSIVDSIGRLAGRLFLGESFDGFKAENLGQTVTVNIPFVSSTVYSLPSSAGVFSLAEITGAVVVSNDGSEIVTTTDHDILTTTEGNALVTTGGNIQFSEPITLGFVVSDAISIPVLLEQQPLLTINGVSASSVTLETNDVISWSFSTDGLNLSLATGGLEGTSIKPSTN